MPIHDSSAAERPRRSDGEKTHAAILAAAVRLASIEGLGSLTIGRLADETGISKSGVFSHFRSKQRLQQETIAQAREIFTREVLEPGLAAAIGRPRIEALCEAYLSYVERGVFPGGCFFAHVLAEFDAATGPLHNEVEADQRAWLDLLADQAEAAQQRGEFDSAADPRQLAFELYAPLELANYIATLHRDPSVIERGRAAVGATIARVAGNVVSG